MTRLLYYDDAYLTEFDAVVLACEETERGFAVELDRTAFYYTSGGQPFDTGVLGGARVLDVYKENGRILHLLERSLEAGAAVTGEIDFVRRFDHMCQHAGEHMIAWAFYEKFGGTTIGLHLGADVSTIDVDMHGGPMKLTAEQTAEIEDMIMDRILGNVPIRCYFPSREELADIPLRKPPAVDENIRIVSIGDFEHVACGGTHPAFAGEVGLVKILDARPSRGKLRVSFMCGMRAYKLFRLLQSQAEKACALLSCDFAGLAEGVGAALDRQRLAEKALADSKVQALLAKKDELLAKARLCAEGRLVLASFEEAGDEALRALAGELSAVPDAAALLFSMEEGKISAVFSRGADVPVHVGNLLRGVFAEYGGKGGGKPDFAMGSLPSEAGQRMDEIRGKLINAFM